VSSLQFSNLDIASAWLTSASLARKANFSPTAYHSVLRASHLGDDASKIEYSKLLWKDGHHRKAIQTIQGALASNAFQMREPTVPTDASISTVNTNSTVGMDHRHPPNKVKAHAELLHAKWLDRAGQTKSEALKDRYAQGLKTFPKWDKGHYYLGRHFNKILESEKSAPKNKQTNWYLTGECAKLVIESYTRSLVYGTKYYYQTIPKLLTLWLDLGMLVANPPRGEPRDTQINRARFLENINAHLKKYAHDRTPTYAWYTAFPQIITRISHPHKAVWDTLQTIILKVASTYPQQALWSLLAVTKATAPDRAVRGNSVLGKLKVFVIIIRFLKLILTRESWWRKRGLTFRTSSTSSCMAKNCVMHCLKRAISRWISELPLSACR
jgi:serine/threonine-protein kinase ATR